MILKFFYVVRVGERCEVRSADDYPENRERVAGLPEFVRFVPSAEYAGMASPLVAAERPEISGRA